MLESESGPKIVSNLRTRLLPKLRKSSIEPKFSYICD